MSIKVSTMQVIKQDRKGRPSNLNVVYQGSIYSMPPKVLLCWVERCALLASAPDSCYKVGEALDGVNGARSALGLTPLPANDPVSDFVANVGE